MKKTSLVKCVQCGRVPAPNEDQLALCKCKGRRYCSNYCKVEYKKIHKQDYKTMELLSKPGNRARAPDMLKPRDKISAEVARQQDILFHLLLVICRRETTKRARNLGTFVEVEGLEQKIHETANDFCTIVPRGDFLSDLLNSPSTSLSGVEEVRLPLLGLDGAITFMVSYEKYSYIKFCYQSSLWSLKKLLYMVVIDTSKIQETSNKKYGEESHMTKMAVEGTSGSLVSAKACVKAVVERWKREKGHEAEVIDIAPNSVRGV